MKEQIKNRIRISINTKELILKDDDLLNLIERLSKDCLDALHNGGKIIFAGNGGSFADAQHLSADSLPAFSSIGVRCLSRLGTNNSHLARSGMTMALGRSLPEIERNCATQRCFHWNPTSGNSPNIIVAFQVAKEMSLRQMAWTGKSGGKLADHCECLRVPSETASIQECHILVGHVLASW